MKKLFSIFCLIAASATVFAQNKTSRAFVSDSLDAYVERALKEWQIPGAAVCIVKDGKVLVMKGYGVKETGKPDKVDENTLFMIGSNTKAFTGTAMAMLAADKKLSLDDNVVKWLPEFKLYDPWVTKNANIRDLLSHRLGFETFQGDFMYFDSDLTAAEVRQKLALVKPLYGYRERWGYTNAAFLVAGDIIPKAAGKTWAEYLKEKIFTPLGMNNTLALSADIIKATNRASAHTVTDKKIQKISYGRIDNIAPAGSISSSVSDMSKWVLAQLNNGKKDSVQVIPISAIDETRLPHSILGSGGSMYNRSHFSLYGLGWFLESYEGRRIVAHTGGVNGFVTSVALIPEENLGIIVLTNTDSNNFFDALKRELVDAYLSLPYRDYSKVYLQGFEDNEKRMGEWEKKKRDTIAMKTATALPLASYAGDYNHAIYGKMKITVENAKLIMKFEHHTDRYGTLEPLGGNRFFCTYSEALYGKRVLPFTVKDGKVVSLTVRVADFVEYTPYEFFKN
ncbi:MAG: serine hydrolase [Gemmatimonadaceae bacterium]|nr:serine hydrolase [Chitinophagaceae bacterium]